METLTGKVRSLLRANFKGFSDELETTHPDRHVTGIVVSRDFARLDDAARMARLWKVLEEGLKPAELRRVGPIAALSPAEAATMPNGSELLAPHRSNGRRNAARPPRRANP